MKKKLGIVISLLMCFSLLAISFGTAEAGSAPATLPDPQVTLTSGDSNFSTELLSIVNLPGVATLSSGMLAPAGFPAGSKQFEGVGIQVSAFTYGSAKACFPVTGTSVGWGGQVGKWDGTKWVLLPTTITAAEEQPYSWACTNIYEDGTYAFIKWVVDPSKLPGLPDCKFPIQNIFPFLNDTVVNGDWQTGSFGGMVILLSDTSVNLSDYRVTVSVASSQPDGYFTLSGNFTGTPLMFLSNVFFLIPSSPVTFSENINTNAINFHLNFGSCVQNFTNSGIID